MQMKRPHIITLSGKPGSGKSSTSDKVAELLEYTRYSSGGFVRDLIKKQKITLSEYNKRAREDHTMDHIIDEELRKLREDKDIVIDSRLGFYWIPESFKVYLDLNLEVATARIYRGLDLDAGRMESGETADSMRDVIRNVEARMKNEQSRFKTLYGIDPYNSQNFDLIIDTAQHSPQTVALTVFDNYKKWLHSEVWKPVFSAVPLGYSLKNEY